MAVNYHVVLKNQAGAQVAIFTDWVSLSFAHVINGLSAFTFEINGNDPRVSLFEKDGQIEVWRSDTALGIAKYLEFEGVIRAFERRVMESESRVFQVDGRGYIDLIARRIIAYYAASIQASKSGPAETVMKAFVNENLGPAATVANGRLADGVMTGVSIAPDLGTGSNWAGGRAYRNVLDVLQELALQTYYDFDVIGIGPALYEFRTYAGQRGLDKTTNGLNPGTGLNGAGNRPVIFSLGFGNMRLPVYRDTSLNEVNAVFALGQGAENQRTIEVVIDAAAIATTPINRREISRDARNEDTTQALRDRADALLVEFQRQQTFNFAYNPTPACQYGRDFQKGDLITARYDEIEVTKKITGITVYCRSPQAEQIGLQLADIVRL